MTVRVVLDTNVIVSAALATRHHLIPAGRPSLCVALALADLVTLVASEELLAEYAGVLERPHFGISHATVRRFVAALRDKAELAMPVPIPAAAVHPKDAHVLAAAVGGRADFLVTGNVRDFPTSYRTTRIVTPATFLTSLVLGPR